MTTLTLADLNLHATDNVVDARFSDREKAMLAAGNAAFNRAIRLGYSTTAARALQRTAKREWVRGESPEDTAVRIVRLPQGSATAPGDVA